MLISKLADYAIPSQFQDGRPIEQLILICDVDGVVRDSTDADADPRIISAIRALMSHPNVDVAFISGTPIVQDPFLDIWKRGNKTLDKALVSLFTHELKEKRMTIYGALGGQRINHEGQVEILDEYSLEAAFEIGRLLLQAFLQEVTNQGSDEQKKLAKSLQLSLNELTLKNKHQSSAITADEFSEIVLKIRSQLDPNFQLASYGASIETHTSNPPWTITHSLQWIENQLDNHPHLLISQMPHEQKKIAGGFARHGEAGFNFLLISKTNKGLTIKKHIEEKRYLYPHALIVTIGDSQVDFPMHQHAHLAYHVGQEQVWKNYSLPHCKIVLDKYGRDSQHVAGTLHVLNLLKQGLGKSIFDWNL
jgi:hypothetical protein